MEPQLIDLYSFRRINQISQGELAEFLCVTRGFISLIENGKAKLPEDKLSKLRNEGVKEKGWDVNDLVPAASRLTALIQAAQSKAKENGEEILIRSEILGIPEYTIKKIMNGQVAITPAQADQIAEKFPDLNKDWLMTGEGDMFHVSADKIPNNTILLKEIRELKEMISDLNKRVDYFGVVLKEMGKMHKT